MNVRRLALDVDKAITRPTIPQIAEAVERVQSVRGINITVTEIDVETIGMDVTIEGEHLDYEQVITAIESTGAVVHSIDQLISGDVVVEHVMRGR